MQMTGVLLVAGTVLLKWSFVAPYVTDRIATWAMAHLFPFAIRDVLMAMFFKSMPSPYRGSSELGTSILEPDIQPRLSAKRGGSFPSACGDALDMSNLLLCREN